MWILRGILSKVSVTLIFTSPPFICFRTFEVRLLKIFSSLSWIDFFSSLGWIDTFSSHGWIEIFSSLGWINTFSSLGWSYSELSSFEIFAHSSCTLMCVWLINSLLLIFDSKDLIA